MRHLEELAKAAIGFDAARGDVLSIQNLSFQGLPLETPAPLTAVDRVRRQVGRWDIALRYLFLTILVAMIYLLMLRPIKKQLVYSFQPPVQLVPGQPLPALAGAGGPPGSEEEEFEKLFALDRELGGTSSDVKKAIKLKRHLVDKVKKDP